MSKEPLSGDDIVEIMKENSDNLEQGFISSEEFYKAFGKEISRWSPPPPKIDAVRVGCYNEVFGFYVSRHPKLHQNVVTVGTSERPDSYARLSYSLDNFYVLKSQALIVDSPSHFHYGVYLQETGYFRRTGRKIRAENQDLEVWDILPLMEYEHIQCPKKTVLVEEYGNKILSIHKDVEEADAHIHKHSTDQNWNSVGRRIEQIFVPRAMTDSMIIGSDLGFWRMFNDQLL